MPPKKDKGAPVDQNHVQLREIVERISGEQQILRDRVGKVEKTLSEHEKSILAMKKELNDIRRQTTKVCIVMYGRDVPERRARENPLEIFLTQVQRKFGMTLDAKEISVCHRRGQKGDLIAKFTHFGIGSSYDRLLRRHNNWNPNENIRIYISPLLTAYDEKIRFYCAKIKECGGIQQWRVGPSGKICIKMIGLNEFKPINDFDEIEKLITTEVRKKIDTANVKRAEARANRRRNRRTQADDVTLDPTPSEEEMDTIS